MEQQETKSNLRGCSERHKSKILLASKRDSAYLESKGNCREAYKAKERNKENKTQSESSPSD